MFVFKSYLSFANVLWRSTGGGAVAPRRGGRPHRRDLILAISTLAFHLVNSYKSCHSIEAWRVCRQVCLFVFFCFVLFGAVMIKVWKEVRVCMENTTCGNDTRMNEGAAAG